MSSSVSFLPAPLYFACGHSFTSTISLQTSAATLNRSHHATASSSTHFGFTTTSHLIFFTFSFSSPSQQSLYLYHRSSMFVYFFLLPYRQGGGGLTTPSMPLHCVRPHRLFTTASLLNLDLLYDLLAAFRLVLDLLLSFFREIVFKKLEERKRLLQLRTGIARTGRGDGGWVLFSSTRSSSSSISSACCASVWPVVRRNAVLQVVLSQV